MKSVEFNNVRIVIPGTFSWYVLNFRKKVEKGLSKGFDFHNGILIEAIEKLERKSDKRTINLFIWLLGLGNRNSDIHIKVMQVLEKLEATNEDIIKGHFQALDDVSKSKFHEDVLLKYGVSKERIVQRYIEVLNSQHYYSRSNAVEALGRLGDDSNFELLKKMYSDKDWRVRRSVAEAMLHVKDERVIDFLTSILKNKNEEDYVRRQAGESLVKLGVPQIVDLLIEAFNDGGLSSYFLEWGIVELVRLGGDRSIEPLIKLLSTKDAKILTLIAKNLGDLGDKKAVDPLIKILDDFYGRTPGITDKISTIRMRIKNWISEIDITYRTVGIISGILIVGAIITTFFVFPNHTRLVASYIVAVAGVILFILGIISYASYPVPPGKGLRHYQGDSDGFGLGTLALIFLTVLAQAINPEEQFIYVQMIEDIKYILLAPVILIATGAIIYIIGNLVMYLDGIIYWKKEGKKWRMEDKKEFHINITIALDKLKDTRAVNSLIKMLSNEDWSIRKSAVIALGNLGDKRAIDPLIKMISDRDSFVRESAAIALGSIGDKRAFNSLIKMLTSKDNMIRGYAATGLGVLGDKRAFDSLIEILLDEDRSVRCNAAMALGNLGDKRAFDPLIKMLSDEDKYVRCNAATALGDLGDKRAFDSLIKLLSDKDRGVAGIAGKALGNLGDTRAVNPLLKIISSEKDTISIYQFEEALKSLGYKGSDNTFN